MGPKTQSGAPAKPVWNNTFGWYWVDPQTGLPVGGRMDLAPANIGPDLPPGWRDNNGGSADFAGVTQTDQADPDAEFDSGLQGAPIGEDNMMNGFAPSVPGAGDDLRDFAAGLIGANPVTDEFGGALVPGDGLMQAQTVALPAVAIALAAALARLAPALRVPVTAAVRRVAVNGRAVVASMPSWVQSALRVAGVTAGVLLLTEAFDDGNPFIPDIFEGNGGSPHGSLPGHVGSQIVGSWQANGVTFYRLTNGSLAVQNKHGRWKVWKPKKPIVLYASGAGSLKTFLRADSALDKQAKKLRKALDRRAPRTRKAPVKPVIVRSGPGVQVIDTG